MTWSLIRRLVVPVVLVFIVLTQVAASGNAEASALVLAGAAGAGSALVLGALKNALGLDVDGRKVFFGAYILAGVIALVSLWLNSQLDFSDPMQMASTIAVAAALQNAVFQLLKDGRLGPFLKDGKLSSS